MIEQQIKNLMLKHFDLVGITQVITPLSIEKYEKWLQNGEHGEMKYLERHLDRKRSPALLLKNAKSWIVGALYYDTQEPLSIEVQHHLEQNKQGWISRYARLNDYHKIIDDKLNAIITNLKKQFPDEDFLGCVDIKAVLERETAQRAGLGWIGKNTCLINKNLGSFIFICEILTSLRLAPDAMSVDHCGTCNKCIQICPTGAIVEDRHVDARKCISYWTIENSEPAPMQITQNLKNNLFGCDLCQDVCPWNKKARKQKGFKIYSQEDISEWFNDSDHKNKSYFDLRDFLQLSVEELKKIITETALERAGVPHLMQTAKSIYETSLNR